MKLAFLLLVLVNVVLFAWQHGVFGHYGDGGREPERVARQVEPERIRVLTEKDVQALRERAKQSSGVVDLGLAQACVEFGDFSAAEAARAEKALAALSTTIKVTVGLVEAPGWYMVYLPPFKTLGEAERRAEELRKLGIKDMLVMNESSRDEIRHQPGLVPGSERGEGPSCRAREDRHQGRAHRRPSFRP